MLQLSFVSTDDGPLTPDSSIIARVSAQARDLLVRWLDMSLVLEQNASSNHPLRGALEFQMAGVDADRIGAVRRAFDGDEQAVFLTASQFTTLYLLAGLWEDRKLVELDVFARNDKLLYSRMPGLRNYVLSDTYQAEVAIFREIVSSVIRAYNEIVSG